MGKRAKIAAVALAAAVARPALAADVLLYDRNSTKAYARTALSDLGVPYTLATTTSFESDLASGRYEVVVIDMPSTVPSGSWDKAIATYLSGGGRVVMGFWAFQSYSSLNTAFDASSASSLTRPKAVYAWDTGHRLFTLPNAISQLPTATDSWADDGDLLTVGSSGTAVGGYATTATSGEAAIVLANSGRSIFNGFLFDSYRADDDGDGTADVVELLGNEIQYLLCDVENDADSDGFIAENCGGDDCDDGDSAISPDGVEVVGDGIDQDCDGEDLVDADGDGAIYTVDCDDDDASIYPGATETCDDVDEDCDGTIDEDAIDAFTWYQDADKDGYGGTTSVTQCDPPRGYVPYGEDCDDSDSSISPDADERCNDVDDDCDGDVDEDATDAATWYADSDEDGYGDPLVTTTACEEPDGYASDADDCWDGDADTHPGATEDKDGVDDDCDGTVDDGTSADDADGDGFSGDGGDCDDSDAAVSPAGREACDGVDEDCDGVVDDGTACVDDDGDGLSEDDGDCNDAWATLSPDAPEIDGNGIDDDCNGIVDDAAVDTDGDGFGPALDCAPTDASAFPGAPEAPDGVDDDCDGEIDEGTARADDDGDGLSEQDGDCDDADADRYPRAPETANGVDDDCDGEIDEGTDAADDDGDGFSEAGGDCDDGDDTVGPHAAEVPNGVDDDCDGVIDSGGVDADQDGVAVGEDCDDADGWVRPGAPEACDGVDNDCDGVVDDGCADAEATPPAKACGCAPGADPRGLVALIASFILRRRGRARPKF